MGAIGLDALRRLGQPITFAIERDPDQTHPKYAWVHVGTATRTIAKIAARLGHPELARAIADLNNVRSITQQLKLHRRIKVPGNLQPDQVFHALPQDGRPPLVTGGYAKFETINRPQRVGLTQFDGYDPITLDIPIQFENLRGGAGQDIETDIALLERMAGRGNAPGTAVGPPPVIRLSVTNAQGATVPLIPTNYQWRPQNKTAPLWRITNIQWDDTPVRNSAGNRVRQRAVVTVQQHTHVATVSRSATQRSKSKPKASTGPNTSPNTLTTAF